MAKGYYLSEAGNRKLTGMVGKRPIPSTAPKPKKRRRLAGSPRKSSEFILCVLVANVPAATHTWTGADTAKKIKYGVMEKAAVCLVDGVNGSDEFDASWQYEIDEELPGSDKKVYRTVINPNPMALRGSTAEPVLLHLAEMQVYLPGINGVMTLTKVLCLPMMDLSIFVEFDKTKTQIPYRPKDTRNISVGGEACG